MASYDIIVFGATGYTGKLTAEYIASHLPTSLKWAIAGRSLPKLEHLAVELKTLNSNRIQPGIEICTLDAPSLLALAKRTRVLISTVGPYARYGEYAFAACAQAGTHYLDVTGEVPWVVRMINKYASQAQDSGAIMIPCNGVESAPADLLTWALTQQVRSSFSRDTRDTVLSLHQFKGQPSGGTLDTLLSLFDEFSLGEANAALLPFAMSPVHRPQVPVTKRDSWFASLFGVVRVPNLGLLTTHLAGSTDCAIIGRTWGLMASLPSRQNEVYGPNFTVHEYMHTSSYFMGVLVHLGIAFVTVLLAVLSPLRSLAKKYVTKPGEGPIIEAGSSDIVEMRGVAWPDMQAGSAQHPLAGKHAFGRYVYKGSMYALTALHLAQAAYVLLQTNLELPGGIYTPACLGQAYIDRVKEAGVTLETTIVDENQKLELTEL